MLNVGLMNQPLKIVSLGIGSKDGHIMSPAAAQLHREGLAFDLRCFDGTELDEDVLKWSSFLKEVQQADFSIIRAHGDVTYFRRWDELKSALQAASGKALLICSEPEVTDEFRGLFRGSDGDFCTLRRLAEIGGDANQTAILLWVLKNCGGLDVEVPPPEQPLTEGVYYEGGRGVPLAEGLRELSAGPGPLILILFHQKFWLTHNAQAIDELIRDVKAQGGRPLTLFLVSSENPLIGSIGIKRIIDNYLIRDGKPIVDAVINTLGFSQTLLAKPGDGTQVSDDNFFLRLNVPIIQAVMLYDSPDHWRDSIFGLSPADIAMSIVDPEFDGQIDTVPFAGQVAQDDGSYRLTSIPDRCRMIAETAVRWGRLRHVPEPDKHVAVLLYMYPPRQDLAGGGYGLDSLQSVAVMLQWMQRAGYRLDWVPQNGKELVTRLLDGVTNDSDWKSDEQLLAASVDTVSPEQYEKWFREITISAQERFVRAWGEPPGTLHTVQGRLLLPGIMDGNVFIGFQPDRGKCTTEAYHDPWTAPPHQYLAFYRWLKYVWGADAVVHIGTHGTLEWLPGKSVGLSQECDPDAILSCLPNVNPYIIDNPGEGMQAKRRSYAVITTHMIPAMTRAGGYEGLNELESAVQAYMKAEEYHQTDKLPSILEKIRELGTKLSIFSDLGLAPDCSSADLGAAVDRLYDYLLGVKDALIKDGLHILGEVPAGERLTETVYTLVRYPNGNVPSLREAVAHAAGLDMEDLLQHPTEALPDGRLKGEAADAADEESFAVIRAMQETDFDPVKGPAAARRACPRGCPDLDAACAFVCGELIASVRHMDLELVNILRALDGEYVEPGPSGCPGRGRAQILPTGRNFYSIDPDGIPWQSSWEIGTKMAEQMVQRYVDEHGEYPKSIGIVIWATDTMKTGGDDIAYVLRLMGLRPVWAGYGGRVKGLEVIPVKELGRPRLDVTLRVSGLFRDTFPNLMNLIDGGVQTVGALDEKDEENYLAAHLREDTLEALAAGVPADEARRLASIRLFGDAPGGYGCGVSDLVQTSAWKKTEDLGQAYLQHGCYVYGKGLSGQAHPELFKKRLQDLNVTVKNHNTRAVDLLDMDDDFDCLGGFNAAVKTFRGQDAESFMGDSSDMQNLKLRTAAEECRFVFRSKINNPKWLNGLKQHGFAGAKELSKMFDYVMGWDATSGIIEDWMYESMANNFVLDKGTKEWIKDENPYAMIAMVGRLQEAIERGLWDPSDDMKQKLKDVYLEFEERIEEITDR